MMGDVAFFSGLTTGLGLIVAIGAQNAFVLRQGLLRKHVLLVVAICAFSDILLITCGVSGIGILIKEFPQTLEFFRYFGAIFLFSYGVMALRRALFGNQSLIASGKQEQSAKQAALLCLGFTFLNPHVYLDTMILIGSIASTFPRNLSWIFACGAGTASILWFSALGFGATLLTPLFKKPVSWRILDFLIAGTMFVIAYWLAFDKL